MSSRVVWKYELEPGVTIRIDRADFEAWKVEQKEAVAR